MSRLVSRIKQVTVRSEELGRVFSRLNWQRISARLSRFVRRLYERPEQYSTWARRSWRDATELDRLKREIERQNPTVQFGVTLFSMDEESAPLQRSVASLLQQVYPHWEAWLRSPAERMAQMRESLPADPRLHFFLSNPLERDPSQISGDYIVPMGAGDVLSPLALAEAALAIHGNPETDLCYSDEDVIDEAGTPSSPYLKPDWSPTLLLSHNYIGRMLVYSKELALLARDRSRASAGPADDYALALFLTEKAHRVGHIPRVLYSRFAANNSLQAAQTRAALSEAMERRRIAADIEGIQDYWRVHLRPENASRVSILICTRDKPALINKCLASIFERTIYRDFEVILIDNGSEQTETLEAIKRWESARPAQFRCIRQEIPFNFSRLNNHAATRARGELLLFLNNDIEVITPEWLTEMAGYAQQPEVGAVSAVLLYPNRTIQHAGILLSQKDLAIHAYRKFPASSSGYKGRLLVPSNFSAVTGACMMLKKGLFTAQGGFDEQLAVAYGDIDLCLKLRQAGYYNLMLPQVKLYHYESATRGYEDTPQKRARLAEESRYFRSRWETWLGADPFYNPNFSQERGDFSLPWE